MGRGVSHGSILGRVERRVCALDDSGEARDPFFRSETRAGLIDPREVQASRAISGSNADPENLSANAVVG